MFTKKRILQTSLTSFARPAKSPAISVNDAQTSAVTESLDAIAAPAVTTTPDVTANSIPTLEDISTPDVADILRICYLIFLYSKICFV